MKTQWKFPALRYWNYNSDEDIYTWRESPEQGGRLYVIAKGVRHYEVDIVHDDRSRASLNQYFARPRDALAALRRDSDFN